MIGLMMDEPLLISRQLTFAARFHGAIEVVSRTVEGPIHRGTYGSIARRAAQLAHALTRLGVKPGDRVATVAWNTHRHLELYFAVSGMGAVLHTINPRLPPDQLCYVINHAEDSLIFFDTTFARLAQLAAAKCPSVRGIVAMTDAAHLPADPPGAVDYEGLLAPEPEAFDWPELDERAASSLCYTSGTAGFPKGVLYSHRSTVLHSYGIAMADALAISAADVTLPVVPMFHVNAWGVPYAAAMTGSKLVLPGPGLDGKSLLELIDTERVTSLLGVPTVWANLLGHLRSVDRRLTTVTKVTIGGAACPPSMIRAFEEEHGARVLHAWGMTETSPLGTANVMLPKHQGLPYEATLPVKSKQGRPIFGVDLRLVDDTGAIVPHDGVTSGHLQVRGPWVASAYFKQDPADGASHVDSWFVTGDIATIDPDGYMQITDRSKDVIKSGGEWVSSIDLENAAVGHPGVAQAAAIGVPHPKWGERPLLIIVRAPGADPTREEIHAFLEARLVKWWLPDAIEFVEALPIGATGKILKRTLREQFGGYSFST
jgi:acyl-CoA synthetase (AMP-forming)/AMP-acid ligase II